MNVLGCADTHAYAELKLFRSSSLLLRLGTGAAGPAFFGLGVKQSLITLLVVDIMYVLAYTPYSIFVILSNEMNSSCAVPAYFAVFGPKLGMRSMVQARYSWG